MELRLGVPDIAGRPIAYPVLNILIDGAESLGARNTGMPAGKTTCAWHRSELLTALHKDGINPNAYSLDVWPSTRKYVLAILPEGWSVY